MSLAKSTDYGQRLDAAVSLAKHHAFLESDINGYRTEITRLDEMADHLAKSKFFAESSPDNQSMESEIEEIKVPRAQVLYAFDRDGVSITKGEVLALLDTSNSDWWRVLKHDGVEGYVPANYIKEIPGETVSQMHLNEFQTFLGNCQSSRTQKSHSTSHNRGRRRPSPTSRRY